MTRPDSPTNLDVIQAWIERYLEDVHVAFPARVQAIDRANQTADLIPLVRHAVPQSDGSHAYEDLPVLPAVPIAAPRAGNFFMWLPVAPGDFVLVVCASAAFEHWRAGDGAAQNPGDLRRHHLSHAIALPMGLVPTGRRLTNVSPADDPSIVIGNDAADGVRVKIAQSGTLVVTKGSAVTIQVDADGIVHLGGAAGEFLAQASLVLARLGAIVEAFNTHTHPASGGATGAPTVPMTEPASVAATKVKGT